MINILLVLSVIKLAKLVCSNGYFEKKSIIL
jgi:hypothetical protein